jgi:hypothetical protein
VVSEFVLGTLVGGALAIAGSFAVQRYQHVLDVRIAHHGDLVGITLQPWLGEISRLKAYTFASGLSQYAWPDPKGEFNFREEALGSPNGLDVTHPFWSRSREHWPEDHLHWDAIENRFRALDKSVASMILELAQVLPEPTQGATWEWQDARTTDFGRRHASATIWSLYWQMKFQELWPVKDLLSTRRVVHGAEVSEEFRVHFHATVAGFFEDRKLDLERLEDQASEIRPMLAGMEQRVLERIHDRKISGNCRYCPHFFSLSS